LIISALVSTCTFGNIAAWRRRTLRHGRRYNTAGYSTAIPHGPPAGGRFVARADRPPVSRISSEKGIAYCVLGFLVDASLRYGAN
jgi:hypothetical protein